MFKYFSRGEKIVFALLAASVALLLANSFWGGSTVFTKIALGIDAVMLGGMTGAYRARKENAEKKGAA